MGSSIEFLISSPPFVCLMKIIVKLSIHIHSKRELFFVCGNINKIFSFSMNCLPNENGRLNLDGKNVLEGALRFS